MVFPSLKQKLLNNEEVLHASKRAGTLSQGTKLIVRRQGDQWD